MLEEILDIRKVQKAVQQVTANKGAGGIDGMQTDELRDYINASRQTLRADILQCNYRPQPVRKGRDTQTTRGDENVGHSNGKGTGCCNKP